MDTEDLYEIHVKNLFLFLFENRNVNLSNFSPNDLCKESTLLSLVTEIEPDFYLTAEIEEIVLIPLDDFKTKKENMTKVLNGLYDYFDKSQSRNKIKFKLRNFINLDSMMDKSKYELLNLIELLFLLSALSSIKETYFNMLGTCEEYLHLYYSILEKFILFHNDPEVSLWYTLSKNFSSHKKFGALRKTSSNAFGDREKNKLLLQIDQLEKSLSSLQNENHELTETLLEIEEKYIELKRENELLISQTKKFNTQDEEEFNDSLKIMSLQNELSRKEIECEELRKEFDAELKKLNNEIYSLKEHREVIEDKLANMKSLHHENEKLKLKVKELSLNKDKLNELSELKEALDKKNNKISLLLKEKENLMQANQNLMRENLTEKQKTKELEAERKKMEYEILDLKREINKSNGIRSTSKSQTGKSFTDKTQQNFNTKTNTLLEKCTSIGGNGDRIPLDQVMFDSYLEDRNSNNQAASDNDEEFNEIKQKLKDEFQSNQILSDELRELKSMNQKLNFELENLSNLKEKILNQKEKVEVEKLKIELDLEKVYLEKEKLENDKVKLSDELTRLKEKVDNFGKEKSNLVKELETCKLSLGKKSNQVEKLFAEKQNLMNELQKKKVGQGGTDSLTPRSNSKKRVTYKVNDSTVDKTSDPVQIKSTLNAKEENIKQLKERIKHLEKMDHLIKSNRKDDELKFYKKAYEEQKARVNNEHEVMANNLYDLAVQFVAFKNELIKNVKPSVSNMNSLNK